MPLNQTKAAKERIGRLQNARSKKREKESAEDFKATFGENWREESADNISIAVEFPLSTAYAISSCSLDFKSSMFCKSSSVGSFFSLNSSIKSLVSSALCVKT
jgi:hypothetical protein